MPYFVYMILTKHNDKFISYVGYTNNLENRLRLHNKSKGAKSTKGYKWILIYSKKFKSKNLAMSYEYKLKKDRILRNELLMKSIK